MNEKESGEKTPPVDKSGHSVLAAHAKWLRQAAAEIRREGHAGWGNTCEQAADAIDDVAPELYEALRVAEAALADIGDSEGEPEPTAAWCENRAYRVLATVRAALARARGEVTS